ncbi:MULTISPECIES: nucleoside triphosphate pyrophosphatase [unclassified Cryobacterium]|uniref:Maf family protein n=1 Tax=unclassified Cryobacterium TaxID=2649013 RepID=UPI002B2353D9|nr:MULTISPECIES: nucleoside triphosphate pyrophosphatase [Cryobacterium]MEB0201803.1 nucleoside triphosphate pyrophosphatase [Cryobacterium sp. 5I3]MEC5151010.1 septum formation protein [Cryobacterium psychrotolerans]
MRLYLASTSPARLTLLRAAGIEPVTIAPGVDEDEVAADAARLLGAPLTPRHTVELLARAKAEDVSRAIVALDAEAADGDDVHLVLGGDSVFVIDGVIYGKPHTAERARERWELQRGRTGQLYSGHWLIEHRAGVPGRAVGAVAVADVTFADDIDDAELDAYIATGEPLFVAGAFTIDSLGAPFITHIEGDPSTVVGLSLPTLRRLVLSLGHSWPSLWNRANA